MQFREGEKENKIVRNERYIRLLPCESTRDISLIVLSCDKNIAVEIMCKLGNFGIFYSNSVFE